MTSVPGVYAIGDSNGMGMLAHVASAEGITVAEHLCGHASNINMKVVPSCIYCEPEIASVGMTEEQVKAAAKNLANVKSFNAALVQVLLGNYAPAAECKCDCPASAYLRAVVAARQGNAEGVKKNLETAKKCEKLAARAEKDIEFAQYR